MGAVFSSPRLFAGRGQVIGRNCSLSRKPFRGDEAEQGHRVPQHSLAVDCFVTHHGGVSLRPSDAVGASGSDFARNSLRELIPLLFGCYSAVSSAVIPLLIPRNRKVTHRKYLNQPMFSRRIFAKTGCVEFFPLLQGNFVFQQTGIYPRRAAEEPAVGSGACSKYTHHCRG